MQKRSEAKNRCQSHRSGIPLVTPLGSSALLRCCGKFLSDGLSDIFFSPVLLFGPQAGQKFPSEAIVHTGKIAAGHYVTFVRQGDVQVLLVGLSIGLSISRTHSTFQGARMTLLCG